LSSKGAALSVRDDWIATSRTSEIFDNPPIFSLGNQGSANVTNPPSSSTLSAGLSVTAGSSPSGSGLLAAKFEFEITAIEVFGFR